MSDFERLSQILTPYAQQIGAKLWVCEKIGRRLSCIARAGEETYGESFIVYEDEKYVAFCEKNLSTEERSLVAEAVLRIKSSR
ncbi:hypothetical protein SAMN04488510_11925 [Fervidobacterium changbaicum]|uniref:Uncharacterized protein n=2 Tax=Fervidobacterium TaxID=2422 RepID=A0AAI8CKF6_FERIS|nr:MULTISPECIES: hypothetical protein [Fervidobacterium]AMW32154.1 hypothetical protein NA23_01725 [Fervidobacterium islandicum]QAV33922.1 hypothetical protein CBS1_09585 [Fervidobacterium changbaicum]SDH56086.1 hypothetical protein SAMN04488510_11925 [Fervidobacterium changbaicum]